jgi:hypothetical protein
MNAFLATHAKQNAQTMLFTALAFLTFMEQKKDRL